VRAVTEINLVEPPFADFAAPIGNPTQSAFSITVPNGTFGGRTEGAFQIISYADGNVNSINLSIPKPSLLAGQGDNFCGLTGSDQAGQITIPSGATGPVTPVVNAAVLANTPIQFSNNPYTTAGPAAGAGVSVVVTAGVGFTFSVPVAPTADLVINWFIPRY
jgi:hypothetical protein